MKMVPVGETLQIEHLTHNLSIYRNSKTENKFYKSYIVQVCVNARPCVCVAQKKKKKEKIRIQFQSEIGIYLVKENE